MTSTTTPVRLSIEDTATAISAIESERTTLRDELDHERFAAGMADTFRRELEVWHDVAVESTDGAMRAVLWRAVVAAQLHAADYAASYRRSATSMGLSRYELSRRGAGVAYGERV